MGDGNSKKSKLSWPKTLVKKWFKFNIKSKAEDFHDEMLIMEVSLKIGGTTSRIGRHALSRKAKQRSSKSHSDQVRRCKIDPDVSQFADVHDYRIFVATWNVAGKSPPGYLNMEDWLPTFPPADIYVLGFQEIVPLNAGNVLGTEDNGPARKWLALIRKTLNILPGASGGFHTPSPVPYPLVELDADFEGSTRLEASSFFHHRPFQSLGRSMRMNNDMAMPQPRLDHRFSVCDRVVLGHRPSDYDPNLRWGSSDENVAGDSPGNAHYSEYYPMSYGGSFALEESNRPMEHSRYCLVASKQMVGIFLTVWVKIDLRDDVRNLKVSCVGRGLMGYLGNKGSISISMSLHRTSFCFVCSHLTSGQKEGDELRRNFDVMEILRKTRFSRDHGTGYDNSPQTILEHDRVIWLGDLNYRIALSYRSAKALLRLEKRHSRVFEGWNEGKIHFPPTYKYSNDSDRYAGEDRHPKEKRTPACSGRRRGIKCILVNPYTCNTCSETVAIHFTGPTLYIVNKFLTAEDHDGTPLPDYH
ncbi:Type I inositol 1,4,5-trisphosphate 5-phosphatase CVP2 [Hibiscus syriacus]|uniref:Type I inositol 1,4,5-trisphosphate 5-phosphatase CVP2 n=1 Tax=Hibiscus syriacus TaxID=106335 RepID=A0A6A2Z0V2_HIBSY|nr:Type I inositol 1,4,5-trisphosphate 5-phosphatase CVP2 [Hibiscus syriacus]